VTRARVIAACEHLGIPCEIVAVKPSDLFDADEVFLTSTIRGLAGVAQIDAHAFPAGGPITGKLRTALARETMREAAAT
jgi:branched-subunit amino acid aminotransferase/4-amino-4-deoxychorismate lyase